MIIIGDEFVPYEKIEKIASINDIKNSTANSTLLFNYSIESMHYCSQNSLAYALKVQSLKEAIYANALHAKYIICESIVSSEIQKCAENYMFDAKIIQIIESNDEFESVASKQIDGVIYKNIL
ncbi:MAG: hypothetical protein ACNI3C_10835 [Candidatus Marinarcus sp.]|uniref:hypothetical protein n=1 Tax=Candidatus Marinarcus sp. TaxID=3100987 RepID=UPI003AFFB2C9